MKELKVTDLNKTYGEKELFNQISFLIHEKDRIGLIGTNGTGKTSLLNILSFMKKNKKLYNVNTCNHIVSIKNL